MGVREWTPLPPDLAVGDLWTLAEVFGSLVVHAGHELLLGGWPRGRGPQAGHA